MNHDPLCPPGWWMEGDGPCEFCALIARAREDERPTNRLSYENGVEVGYERALRDAVEAVKEIENNPESSTDYSRDYDIDKSGDTRSPRIWLREAITVIEALGVKQ